MLGLNLNQGNPIYIGGINGQPREFRTFRRMRKDCSELLKELKVTTMILKKIINELSQIISEDNEETQKIKRLLRTL